MNIPDIPNKIKSSRLLGDSRVFYYTILSLACIVSFYLGYMAKEAQGESNLPVIIECPISAYKSLNTPDIDDNIPNTEYDTKTTQYPFIASKNGKNYYPSDCKSAGRINADNIVGFGSYLEAENAGYIRSKLCN